MNRICDCFGLELHNSVDYHKDAMIVNARRNTFENRIQVKIYKKVYLPKMVPTLYK